MDLSILEGISLFMILDIVHSIISDLLEITAMSSKKHLVIKLTVLSIDTYLLLKMKWGV